MPPLPWTTFAPPLSRKKFGNVDACLHSIGLDVLAIAWDKMMVELTGEAKGRQTRLDPAPPHRYCQTGRALDPFLESALRQPGQHSARQGHCGKAIENG